MITKSTFDHQAAEARQKMLAQAIGEIDAEIQTRMKRGGQAPIAISIEQAWSQVLGPIQDAYTAAGWKVSIKSCQRDGDDLVLQ